MATAAQIEANRHNASRSTGPKTARGKLRARVNAFKHGHGALTLLPGLTHEDPQQLRAKTLRLIDDLQPGNQAELDQVCQAARLTLAIERAERLEMAHMNRRIRDAAHTRAQDVDPRLLEDIQELGRRLLYIAAAEEVKLPRQPLWADDPRLLVAKLQASAEGCRWLLVRWAELRILLDRRYRWDTPTLLRCIRLQGKQVAESVYDPALNLLFVAWDVLVPKFAVEEWENFREERFRDDPSFNHRQRWREIVARPPTEAEAWEVLYSIIEIHVEDLNELLAANEAREAVADDDWADRAALDLSAGFERLRRYQSAKTRELQRTLETLCKLRKAELGMGNEREGMVDGECRMAVDKCQMADEPCAVEAADCELETPQEAPNEPNLQSTQATDAQGIESEKADSQGRERSQSEAGGQVVGDAGRDDSHRHEEGATNDAPGIAPQERTDSAVEASRGAGPEPSPARVTTPKKAPNEPNLQSTQNIDSQGVESEKPEPPRRERSQFAAGGRVVQGAGDERVATRLPAGDGGGEARGRVGLCLPEAAFQDVVPDGQGLPIFGTRLSRAPDAKPATRRKPSPRALATAAILRRPKGAALVERTWNEPNAGSARSSRKAERDALESDRPITPCWFIMKESHVPHSSHKQGGYP